MQFVHGAATSYFRARYRLGRGRMSLLLINAPARSGTSLLANLLCSHPDTVGYGETKMVYESPRDIERMVGEVHWTMRRPRMDARYVLDKLVHNELSPRPGVFDDVSARWIYIVRDPVETVGSLVAYLECTPSTAVAYYIARLERLAQDAQRWGTPVTRFVLTYEELTHTPDATLAALSDFLALPTPLDKEYSLHKKAGDPGVGDQSERLRAGSISRPPKRRDAALPPEDEEAIRRAHEQCLVTLRQHCTATATASA